MVTEMKAFQEDVLVAKGKGVYIYPGTWHNGIYVEKKYCPAKFVTKQGAVHARISCSVARRTMLSRRRVGTPDLL